MLHVAFVSNYKFIHCFWNANFNFWNGNIINEAKRQFYAAWKGKLVSWLMSFVLSLQVQIYFSLPFSLIIILLSFRSCPAYFGKINSLIFECDATPLFAMPIGVTLLGQSKPRIGAACARTKILVSLVTYTPSLVSIWK